MILFTANAEGARGVDLSNAPIPDWRMREIFAELWSESRKREADCPATQNNQPDSAE